MSALAQITVGLAGAVRLAKLDTSGFDYFEDTTDAFWRSFLAAWVVAPLFVLYLIVGYLSTDHVDSFAHYLIIELLAYAIAWLAFPLVMLNLARPLDREDRVVRYLVAFNWISVVQNAVYMPIVILGITGALGDGLANMMALVVFLWVLGLTFFVTRKALELPAATTAGIVVMDLLLGVLIETVTNRVA